jgi:hypothetical protein
MPVPQVLPILFGGLGNDGTRVVPERMSVDDTSAVFDRIPIDQAAVVGLCRECHTAAYNRVGVLGNQARATNW